MTGVVLIINKKKEVQVAGTPSRIKAVVLFHLEITLETELFADFNFHVVLSVIMGKKWLLTKASQWFHHLEFTLLNCLASD